MPRLREHVEWRRITEFVAAGGEALCVAGQGRWVAGDVDDALGGYFQYRVDDFFIAACARRVEDYGVEAARGQLFGYVFGLRGARLDVVHAVAREVLFYVFRGGEPAFDRGDAAGARGEEGGEAADAGVEFEHFARAALRGEGRGAAVERERLFRIYLKEGRCFKCE